MHGTPIPAATDGYHRGIAAPVPVPAAPHNVARATAGSNRRGPLENWLIMRGVVPDRPCPRRLLQRERARVEVVGGHRLRAVAVQHLGELVFRTTDTEFDRQAQQLPPVLADQHAPHERRVVDLWFVLLSWS